MIPVSKRMKAIADMVPSGYSVADIGCDHAFIAMYLVTYKDAPKAIAMDINEGPIAIASEHIAEYGLSDRISTRLSDGAKRLEDSEVDCAIIAGMGGSLIVRILKESIDKFLNMKSVVLSPQSQIPQVRVYLNKAGFVIVDENMVIDEGKYYTIMRCCKGSEKRQMCDVEYEFGPKLIENRNPILALYLEKEKQRLSEVRDRLLTDISLVHETKREDRLSKIREFESRIDLINRAISKMQ